MKKGQQIQMLLGLIAVFALFHWLASELESFRGEYGVIVGIVVVGATVVAQRLLFRDSFAEAARSVGLRRPKVLGVIVAVVIGMLMLLVVPLFAWQTGSTFSMYPIWQWLMIGLFFQAGLAEEALFRGYLFGYMRDRHSFWKAASFAAIPFVLVHLILFTSLPWPLAAASILLAIVMSFPFSKLYEMGGNSIWAPAIVHFAAQAIAKMFVFEGESSGLFSFAVIAVSAVAPLAVFVVPMMMRMSSVDQEPLATDHRG